MKRAVSIVVWLGGAVGASCGAAVTVASIDCNDSAGGTAAPIGAVRIDDVASVAFELAAANFAEKAPDRERRDWTLQSAPSPSFGGGINAASVNSVASGLSAAFSLVEGLPLSDGLSGSSSPRSNQAIPVAETWSNATLERAVVSAAFSSPIVSPRIGW